MRSLTDFFHTSNTRRIDENIVNSIPARIINGHSLWSSSLFETSKKRKLVTMKLAIQKRTNNEKSFRLRFSVLWTIFIGLLSMSMMFIAVNASAGIRSCEKYGETPDKLLLENLNCKRAIHLNRSLNGTTLKDVNGIKDATSKPLNNYNSNGTANQSFSEVKVTFQQTSVEIFSSNLQNVDNEMVRCIQMYVGLFVIGCIVLFMGLNISCLNLNIYALLLDRYWYRFGNSESRRSGKKKIQKDTTFGFGKSKSKRVYGHRFRSLFSVKWMPLFFIVVSGLVVGASAYDQMPDDCYPTWTNDDYRDCDPRKAVDELDADGSGTHAKYGPMKDWDMSQVTDLSYLFYQKGTMNADLSSWDVSGVTTMEYST